MVTTWKNELTIICLAIYYYIVNLSITNFATEIVSVGISYFLIERK